MPADITISAQWRTQQVRELLDRLSPKRQSQALSVAVNTTARQVRTHAARNVAKAMGMKRGDVDRAIRIYPLSNPSTLSAVVRGTGAPLPLIKFGARQTKTGVTSASWNVRKLYPGAFVATMPSGHKGVFHRVGAKRVMKHGRFKGKERQPIKEMWGAGVAQTMSESAVLDALQAIGSERLQANVMRQLQRYARSV